MKKVILISLLFLFYLPANAQSEIKKEFYSNGKLKIETPFVDGKICGSMKKYCKDDKIIGDKKEYYENGTLKTPIIINYDENGEKK